MRAYFFGNMYLSSIQQGIQAAHAVHEMFIRFPTREQDGGQYLWDWAVEHKTMVLLNAGYADEIRSLIDLFNNPRNPYPWAEFREEQASLDGALTTVGIILPPEIYSVSKEMRESLPGLVHARIFDDNGWTKYVDENGDEQKTTLTKWQVELAGRLNGYGLAK